MPEMPDSHLTLLAAVLVHYSTAVKRGDLVTIVADPAVLQLTHAVEAIFAAVLKFSS